ncbi:MAG: histidine kinase [Saprospiraceae bacterium]|nr:histidine kinase [Saprospiraceae bacterium]
MRERRIEKEASLKNLIAEYRYDLLASQINPHFLFNSFNVLAALIPKEPAKAGEFLETLSDFYREIVQIKDTDNIPIEKEIFILERYYYLLKQRFGNALLVSIEIPDMKGFLIPFTLQLLLENAVKHNIVSTSKPLNVLVKRQGDFICVKNNIQTKFSSSESTGFGLSSLKERYQQYSPNKFEILNDNHYFEVRIPIIHK